MTRLELEIAEVVKRASEHVQITIKAKTKDGIICTLEEYQIDKNDLSEKDFFDSLKNHVTYSMNQIREILISRTVIWTQHEGKMIATDNIKDVWVNFNPTPLLNDIALEG